MRIYKISS